MTRKISLLLILIASIFATSLANADAYIRGASAPWDRSTNEAAMDAAFGAGNWDDLRMADGAGPFAPGAHTFIFLEGGDDTAIELSNFLAANKTAIENFVNGGGALLLNSAPNQGSNIDFGFGGVTLTYPSFTGTVTAVDATHPIFIGPFTPVVTDYTGGWFGHAIVGGGVTPLIIGAPGDDSAGETVLGEMAFGSGLVMFGGMTTDNYHSPQPEAANLLANIVTYTAAGGGGFVAAPALPIPSLSSWSLVILAALMLLVGFRFRRRLS
jgi:hypothetical protein